MKFLKEKMRSPRFWTALGGAITMILLAVGVRIPAPAVNEILGSISAFLIVIGFVKPAEEAKPDDESPPQEKTDDEA